MSGAEPRTWRVYRRMRTVAYTSDQAGEAGFAECARVFGERWDGRVAGEDADIVPLRRGDPGRGAYMVILNLPGCAGEWKDERDAEDFAALVTGGIVVASGSPEERDLLDYGKKRIRS